MEGENVRERKGWKERGRTVQEKIEKGRKQSRKKKFEVETVWMQRRRSRRLDQPAAQLVWKYSWMDNRLILWLTHVRTAGPDARTQSYADPRVVDG